MSLIKIYGWSFRDVKALFVRRSVFDMRRLGRRRIGRGTTARDYRAVFGALLKQALKLAKAIRERRRAGPPGSSRPRCWVIFT